MYACLYIPLCLFEELKEKFTCLVYSNSFYFENACIIFFCMYACLYIPLCLFEELKEKFTLFILM